jgi:hypothetical protein
MGSLGFIAVECHPIPAILEFLIIPDEGKEGLCYDTLKSGKRTRIKWHQAPASFRVIGDLL